MVNETTEKAMREVSYQEALEWADGREYTLDGIHGVIKLAGKRPYQQIMHEPSDRGRRSEAYLKTKAELRDHWSTDLTMSERLPEILMEIGVGCRYDHEKHESVVLIPC